MKKFWKINNKVERFRLKRYYKKQRRKIRVLRKEEKVENLKFQKFQKYNNIFCNFINKNYKPKFLNDKKNTVIEYIPKIFSLSENYDESIRAISNIASLCTEKILKKTKLIYIDMKKCEKYDLDASCILDSVMDKLKYIGKSMKTDFKVDFPLIKNNHAYINFLTTSFVNDELFKTKGNIPVYELRKKYSESKKVKFVDFNKNRVTDAGIIVTEVADMIFSNSNNNELYRRQIGNILGEIIDNIKEHSGNENPWYIAGNLIPCDEYNKSRIELVIMNYGKTFSDNLSEFLSGDTKKEFPNHFEIIESAVNKILEKQKMFILNNYYSKEDIYTYILLQQGFSSKIKYDDNRSRRGSGIIKLLEAIENISNTEKINESNMILYTGKTCIKFLNKYIVSENVELDKKRKVICLNEKNSLFSKLDRKAIYNNSISFPGTIIYLNFELKEELIYE